MARCLLSKLISGCGLFHAHREGERRDKINFIKTLHFWWKTRRGSTDPRRNKIGSSAGKTTVGLKDGRRKNICSVRVVYRMFGGNENTM
jgi:hypothetical protein